MGELAMRRSIDSVLVVIPLLVGASMAQAVDLAECQQIQVGRWDGVTHYLVDQSMMGQRVAVAFERFEAPGPDGTPIPAFRPRVADSDLSSEQLRAFAGASEQVGEGLSREMAAAGFPSGMLGGSGGDPWTSTDPRTMMSGNAEFLRAAADAQDANQRERDAAVIEASEAAATMAEVQRKLRRVGSGPIDSRPATHFRAEGLKQVSQGGPDRMVIETLDLWIDERECVPLKMTMTGTVTSEGQTRPVTVERLDGNYQRVPGSKMYEPHRQVIRLKGALNEAQQREMRESQAKLADLEKQLAQMPAGQRDMIMQRMGPQMEMMKRMASGGDLELVTEVHAIHVNPDQATMRQVQMAATAASMGGSMGGAMGMSMNTASPAVAPAPSAAPTAAATPAAADKRSAQQACLEERARKQQEAQKKKRGLGSLVSAVARNAGRLGGEAITSVIGEAQNARATADDLSAAAKDLGLSEDDVAACRDAS
jgi:hypothetical protein